MEANVEYPTLRLLKTSDIEGLTREAVITKFIPRAFKISIMASEGNPDFIQTKKEIDRLEAKARMHEHLSHVLRYAQNNAEQRAIDDNFNNIDTFKWTEYIREEIDAIIAIMKLPLAVAP